MSKQFLILLTFLFVASQTAFVAAGYIDATRPGDPIKLVTGFNQGDNDAGPPPDSETEIHAIDDMGQKYLNFSDLSSGIAVTPSANPDNDPIVGIRLYTANDVVARDPASFQLSGSNDGLDGPWTHIASGNFVLPDERNDGGTMVSIPPQGNLTAYSQEIMFGNADHFAHYQIIFPTLKDAAAANSMQIGEIEFLIGAVPEPSSGGLTAMAAVAFILFVRRRSR